MTDRIHALQWENNTLKILDQTKLPGKKEVLPITDYRQVIHAIKVLAVRGAPAIGVAAAYAMVLAVREYNDKNIHGEKLKEQLHKTAAELIQARPTAVNLSWAVRRMEKLAGETKESDLYSAFLKEAGAIEEEDRKTCDDIADYGAAVFEGKQNLSILTHCNTGALATAGIGTAFGVIYRLSQKHQIACVYADETRPLLQGARLTGTELMEAGIPCRLICDDMAASVMKNKHISAVIVGADRIASNGDAANKIGTYGLAVLASYHHVPFYIAAPFSTFDFSIHSGNDIQIEERDPDEVRKIKDIYTAPRDIPVFNPAFDVVPNGLITGIITEHGVLKAPYSKAIQEYERSLANNV